MKQAIVQLISLAAVSFALAADEPTSKGTRPQITPFNKATSVVGMAVQDTTGAPIAKVRELVFDLETQRLSYALLAVATPHGERLVPVPVSALKPTGDHFVLNMNTAVFAAAQSVNNDQWPALNSFAVGAPASAEQGQGKSSDHQ